MAANLLVFVVRIQAIINLVNAGQSCCLCCALMWSTTAHDALSNLKTHLPCSTRYNSGCYNDKQKYTSY